jgi:hypothetical protein
LGGIKMKVEKQKSREHFETVVIKISAIGLLLILLGTNIGQGASSKWQGWTEIKIGFPSALQQALDELVGDWWKLRRSWGTDQTLQQHFDQYNRKFTFEDVKNAVNAVKAKKNISAIFYAADSEYLGERYAICLSNGTILYIYKTYTGNKKKGQYAKLDAQTCVTTIFLSNT